MHFLIKPATFVLLSTNFFFPIVKAADNSLVLGNFESSSFEVFDPAGTSTVTVTYDVDGATMGNNDAAGTDFYIKHEMLAKDCGGPYTGSGVSVTLAEPDATTVYGKVTSTLTNTAAWEPGSNEFCMQYTLYMLGPTTPFEWQVKGFNIKVDITYATDQYVVTTDTTNIALELPGGGAEGGTFPPAVESGTVIPNNDPPSLGNIAVGGTGGGGGAGSGGEDGTFEYGEEWAIGWDYDMPVDFYDFTVDPAKVFLIDPADDLPAEYPEGTVITFADVGGSVTYIETGTYPNLKGQISVTVPLKVYQSGLTQLKLQFSIQYSLKDGLSNPVRRRLQAPNDSGNAGEEAPLGEAYLKGGRLSEVVKVNLAPLPEDFDFSSALGLSDEEGGQGSAATGDYHQQYVSAMCFAGAATLFIR